MSATDTGIWDPFTTTFTDDPYPIYKVLRDEYPAYHNQVRDVWALSRYADVADASTDWQTFSSEGSLGGIDLDHTSRDQFGEGTIVEKDPPVHDQLRAMVRHRFTAKTVQQLEPFLRAEVQRLLAPWDGNEIEVMEALAYPLTIDLITALIGVDAADRAYVGERFKAAFERDPGSSEIPARAHAAAADVRAVFADLARRRRDQPGDDVMTDVLAAGLSERIAVGLCFGVLGAGVATASGLVAACLYLLGTHPDERAKVVADEARIPRAIDEMVRYDTPLQNLARTTTREVELHGETLPAGARVALLWGSANRDERRFENPDRLDFDRGPKRHFAFGNGIHFCLGAPLARLEARIAIEEVLARMPQFAVARTTRIVKQNERSFEELVLAPA
jgi:cytochrome P450